MQCVCNVCEQLNLTSNIANAGTFYADPIDPKVITIMHLCSLQFCYDNVVPPGHRASLQHVVETCIHNKSTSRKCTESLEMFAVVVNTPGSWNL